MRDRKRCKIGIGSQKLTIGNLLDDVLRDSVINRQSIEWAKIVINRHLRPAFGDASIAKFSTILVNNRVAGRLERGRGMQQSIVSCLCCDGHFR